VGAASVRRQVGLCRAANAVTFNGEHVIATRAVLWPNEDGFGS